MIRTELTVRRKNLQLVTKRSDLESHDPQVRGKGMLKNSYGFK